MSSDNDRMDEVLAGIHGIHSRMICIESDTTIIREACLQHADRLSLLEQRLSLLERRLSLLEVKPQPVAVPTPPGNGCPR